MQKENAVVIEIKDIVQVFNKVEGFSSKTVFMDVAVLKVIIIEIYNLSINEQGRMMEIRKTYLLI